MKRNSVITAAAIAVFCAVLGLTAFAASRPAGQQDLVQRYDLPAYANMSTGAAAEQIEGLQVVQKAATLGLAMQRPVDLASVEDVLVDDLETQLSDEREWHMRIDFEGGSAQDLQDVIDANPGALVNITASQIEVDQPLYLGNETHIQGNGVRLNCTAAGAAVRIQGSSNVTLANLDFAGSSDFGVLVDDSDYVQVTGCNFRRLGSKGVLVMGESTYFRIAGNTFTENHQGAVMVGGNSAYGLVENNVIGANEGYSNWMAGIVLTSLAPQDPLDIWQQFPDDPPHFPVRETLAGITRVAHDVVVRSNTVRGGTSSGIYVDGAYSCFLSNNSIIGNDKEGICLDYGALACRVHGNNLVDNGRRARQSDQALERDGMLDYGRLADESAVAKLPAISLDNAAYNQIDANRISSNWGGGVKIVRCGVRNVVADNVIANNNLGENDTFYFVGVELGNAEGDNAPDMDYAASFQNMVVGNTITGSHYTGIIISRGGAGNLVGGNTIRDQERFSIANASKLPNDLSGNRYSGYIINRSALPV